MYSLGFMETGVANVTMFMLLVLLLDSGAADVLLPVVLVVREYTGTDTGGGDGMGVLKDDAIETVARKTERMDNTSRSCWWMDSTIFVIPHGRSYLWCVYR